MRKISLVLIVAVLLSVGNVFANDVKEPNPSKQLSAQISQMLNKNRFFEIAADLTAQVRFTLNNEQEIVILSVETEAIEMEEFIKARLNYKKVALPEYTEGKIYTIPVRIES